MYSDFPDGKLDKSKNGVQIPHGTLRHPRHDFVVVTCVFNPRGYASRYRLYEDFKKYCEASNVLLVTVEIALGDRPFYVTAHGNLWNLQLRTPWELWHKERALNLGIQKALDLVPGCRYLAWIDADVTFARYDWPAATCEALQHHKVVQMFGEAINLDPDEHRQYICKSSLRLFDEKGYWHTRDKKLVKGHPGLAWAARRHTLDRLGGLYDQAISGSGDSHMANMLMGRHYEGDSQSTLSGMSPGFLKSLQAWGTRADLHVQQDIGYVPGLIMHHWHGKSRERGHKARWDVAKAHQFDPYTDLLTDCLGLYRLASGREKMGDDIRRTLSERNEDSIDV